LGAQSAYELAFPEHVAIIMDGNGRWARARHRPRVFGHQAGVKTVRRIVEDASELGIKCLTLYSFSTENWTRGRGVRVRIIGSRDGLENDILEILDKVEERTRNNTDFNLNIAFNYGGRDEILRAVQRASTAGEDMQNLSDIELEKYFDTYGLPEVDMVIRTSGEKRISNFLLWQAAYAEFIFTDVLWPDFKRADLEAALGEFCSRDRRFGNLSAIEVA